MKKFIVKILATGFGLGYSPVAPGTFGSLLGVLFFYLLRDRFCWFVLAFAVIGVGSFWIAGEAEKIFGTKDCQKIVIDEVAGQMLAYLFIAFTWKNALIGFVLFRFFDMVKIFPANWAQKKLPGGFGVVGDDLVAGLQAAGVLYLFYLFK